MRITINIDAEINIILELSSIPIPNINRATLEPSIEIPLRVLAFFLALTGNFLRSLGRSGSNCSSDKYENNQDNHKYIIYDNHISYGAKSKIGKTYCEQKKNPEQSGTFFGARDWT